MNSAARWPAGQIGALPLVQAGHEAALAAGAVRGFCPLQPGRAVKRDTLFSKRVREAALSTGSLLFLGGGSWLKE